MGQVNHSHVFLYSLRTAILATVGFFLYEILISLDKKFKKEEFFNIHRRYLLKFIFIFIIDLIILYIFAKLLNMPI